MQIAKYRATHNEGGEGFNPHDRADAEQAAARSEAYMADLVARAGELRAAWNAAVAQVCGARTQVTMQDVAQIERISGLKLRDMQSLKSRLGSGK